MRELWGVTRELFRFKGMRRRMSRMWRNCRDLSGMGLISPFTPLSCGGVASLCGTWCVVCCRSLLIVMRGLRPASYIISLGKEEGGIRELNLLQAKQCKRRASIRTQWATKRYPERRTSRPSGFHRSSSMSIAFGTDLSLYGARHPRALPSSS